MLLIERRFVEEGLVREIENPFEAGWWERGLGGGSFARKMQDKLGAIADQGREMTGVRKGQRRTEPGELIGEVGRSYGITNDELLKKGGYGMEARNVAMALIWEKSDLSLREIGDL